MHYSSYGPDSASDVAQEHDLRGTPDSDGLAEGHDVGIKHDSQSWPEAANQNSRSNRSQILKGPRLEASFGNEAPSRCSGPCHRSSCRASKYESRQLTCSRRTVLDPLSNPFALPDLVANKSGFNSVATRNQRQTRSWIAAAPEAVPRGQRLLSNMLITDQTENSTEKWALRSLLNLKRKHQNYARRPCAAASASYRSLRCGP